MKDQESNTIGWDELPTPEPGSVLAEEWNTYRREVSRLLKEGHENQHVLIKGSQIIGIWKSHEEALQEGYKRYLMQAFLVHQVRTRECAEIGAAGAGLERWLGGRGHPVSDGPGCSGSASVGGARLERLDRRG